ncbi:hypothetical protein C8R44DRAFT_620314, partial [Mycena epipterygia]
TDRRSNIALELMEVLQMLKFAVKKDRGLNFPAGMPREEELWVLELAMDTNNLVPEDVTGFSSFINAGYNSD